MDKSRLLWVEDSSLASICCRNEPNLTLKDATIGRVFKRDGQYVVLLADETNITPQEGAPSLYRARAVLEAHYFKTTAEKNIISPRKVVVDQSVAPSKIKSGK